MGRWTPLAALGQRGSRARGLVPNLSGMSMGTPYGPTAASGARPTGRATQPAGTARQGPRGTAAGHWPPFEGWHCSRSHSEQNPRTPTESRPVVRVPQHQGGVGRGRHGLHPNLHTHRVGRGPAGETGVHRNSGGRSRLGHRIAGHTLTFGRRRASPESWILLPQVEMAAFESFVASCGVLA